MSTSHKVRLLFHVAIRSHAMIEQQVSLHRDQQEHDHGLTPLANASMAASVTSLSSSSSSLTTGGGRCRCCGAGDGRPLP